MSTNDDARIAPARHTGRLSNIHTGRMSLQCQDGRILCGLSNNGTIYFKHRACQFLTGRSAVTDYHYIVKRIIIFLQPYNLTVRIPSAIQRNLCSFVTNILHNQRAWIFLLFYAKRKTTICISHRSTFLSIHGDIGANHRRIVCCQHLSRHLG